MRKTEKIKPPRKPRGENKAVTIANQDRQIRQLIDRVQELSKSRDEYLAMSNRRLMEMQDVSSELFAHKTELADMAGAIRRLEFVIERMNGWKDCAREIMAARP